MEPVYDYYLLSSVNMDLIKALSLGNNDLVEKCLKQGANPNMSVQLDMITGSGKRIFIEMFTPLTLALKYKNEEAIRLLNAFGAKPNKLFFDYVSDYESSPGDVEAEVINRLAKLCE